MESKNDSLDKCRVIRVCPSECSLNPQKSTCTFPQSFLSSSYCPFIRFRYKFFHSETRENKPAATWCASNLMRLFTCGFYSEVAKVLKHFLDQQQQQHSSGVGIQGWNNVEGLWRLMWNTAGRTDSARLGLRDLGLVTLCMKMLDVAQGAQQRPLLGFLTLMCTYDTVHGTLKDAGVVDAFEKALEGNKSPIGQLSLLAALAHLCR